MSLQALWQEVGDALQAVADALPGLTVYPHLHDEPTPPAIDFYPATPFQTGAALPAGDNQVFIVVRARVATADPATAQQLLLRLLDTADPASVEMALMDVAQVVPDGVSGFSFYADDLPSAERMVGCDWRVTAFYDNR